MEELKTKLEELTKERETLVKQLQELDTQYKLGVRNLDRIDGAIFILKETLEPKVVKTSDITESKH